MTLRQLFELMHGVWEAYRPWLPLRAAKDSLTAVGHPLDGLLGGGQWVAFACVIVVAAVLLGVSLESRHAAAHSTTSSSRTR